MSAKITNIIPDQTFEVILGQIGAIIKVELDNQKTLQTLTEPINVYNSRSSSFNDYEKLMINVSLDSSSNSTFGNS